MPLADAVAIELPVVLAGLVLTLLAGVACGGAALALSHVITSLLFGVTPIDTVSFVAACAVVTVLALAASLLPAREAIRLSAASALRPD